MSDINSYNQILSEIGQLFFSCGSGVPLAGVPFSDVCNGVLDCSSGADESICDTGGYASCSFEEFTCASRQCIPLEARCDLLQDCQDGSDEENCDLDCPHRLCTNGRCLPRAWFHDGQVDCSDGSDESTPNEHPCIFICNRTKCVTRHMLNDSVVDCRGPEGPLDETLGALESVNCTGDESFRPTYTNNWAPKCVLVNDNWGETIGCRDFQHLENCKDFICPAGYAKCPESFCIPLGYINDGKQDCGEGEDESPQFPHTSTQLFKCHPHKRQYIPLQSVCDGRKDCSLGEDEFDCDYTCSPGFICIAGAVSAVRYNKNLARRPNLMFIGPGTRYLDLSGLYLPDFFTTYPKGHFSHLLILNLSSCGITDDLGRKNLASSHSFGNPNSKKDFRMVQKLDLSHNEVVSLRNFSLVHRMRKLKELNLSHNNKFIDVGGITFMVLRQLKVVDLSFTAIDRIYKYSFDLSNDLETLSLKQTRITKLNFYFPKQLQYLNIEQTIIEAVDKGIFKDIQKPMREISSSSYKVCCPQVLGTRIPGRVCHFPKESVSSCTDLISERSLRVMLWLIGLSNLVGNVVTLIYRLTWDRKLLLKPYGLFVTNLGVCDVLMGCYLIAITVADTSFQ
ncbi:G-protein coupled receptor GRL101-like, partial [Elysia marginata]